MYTFIIIALAGAFREYRIDLFILRWILVLVLLRYRAAIIQGTFAIL